MRPSQYPREWETYFPSIEESKVLYDRYFFAVDPVIHIIHRPSFEVELHNFLFSPPSVMPVPSFKAVLLAMYLAAAISMCPVECQIKLQVEKHTLVAKLEIAAEKALTEADFMRSAKFQTLQAFTIYMVSSTTQITFAAHTL